MLLLLLLGSRPNDHDALCGCRGTGSPVVKVKQPDYNRAIGKISKITRRNGVDVFLCVFVCSVILLSRRLAVVAEMENLI